jgi:CheY-like chemotaxis protein
MTDRSRILILEDEPLIAMMLEEFVDILGMDVAATTDDCASAIAAMRLGAVDGAIVDVNLKGGERLDAAARELAERGIPFVVASGDVGAPAPWDGRPLLSKPYSLDAVGRALSAIGMSSGPTDQSTAIS